MYGGNEMDGFSMIFLFGMFTPGLIRGAFWYDSPAVEGVFWLFPTIGVVLVVGWVTQQIFGSGIAPTISMVMTIIVANIYAIKGSTFSSSPRAFGYDIDGDVNE